MYLTGSSIPKLKSSSTQIQDSGTHIYGVRASVAHFFHFFSNLLFWVRPYLMLVWGFRFRDTCLPVKYSMYYWSLVQFHRYGLYIILLFYIHIYKLDTVNGTISIKFCYLLLTVLGSVGHMIIELPFFFLISIIIIKYENRFKIFYDFCVVNVFARPSSILYPKPLSIYNQIKLSKIVFAFLHSIIRMVCSFGRFVGLSKDLCLAP